MINNFDKNNKVILIGGNNHSGLGAVRSFGVNGINPYGIIISSDEDESRFVEKSKYWKRVWRVNSEEEAVELILSKFAEETLPPVLIPWSDSAEKCIDRNLDRLKGMFIVPSINGEAGSVVSLMNKYSQIEFATKHDIPVVKTLMLDLKNINIPDAMVFPCIIKPVASYEGNKLDIGKCKNLEELETKIERLRRLDGLVKNTAIIWSLVLGVLGCLIFGLGLTMILEWDILLWGIILMVIGSVPMAIAYPVYKLALNKGKAKYGDEILRLSEELLNEK